MKLTVVLQKGLFVTLLSCPLVASAAATADAPPTNLVIEKNDVYIPEVRERAARHEVIQALDSQFTYDWNQFATISSNQKTAEKVNLFVQKIGSEKDLNKEDHPAMGRLLYRLGAFYAHVTHASDAAIDKLNLAQLWIKEKELKAWSYNHLAYAYERKYAHSLVKADKDKALHYTNQVLKMYPKAQNRQIAYAYFIQGLVKHEAKEYSQSNDDFKNALNIYAKLSANKDDQAVSVKNKFAETLLIQGKDKEAMTLLEETQKYWQAKGHLEQNPFAARNLLALGEAHLKTGEVKQAQLEILQAISTYQRVYGLRDERLEKAYLLLAKSYQQTGEAALAKTYEQKATSIKKG